MNSSLLLVCVLIAANSIVSSEASADVGLYFDYAEWQGAIGATTTIGFADLAQYSFVTTQYQGSGVLFTDGLDQVVGGISTYPQDGAGLYGHGSIDLLFSSPMHGVALHFPGFIQFQLYDGDIMMGHD